jgi:hypothetical protein
MRYREIYHARDQSARCARLADRMVAPAYPPAAIGASPPRPILPSNGYQQPEVLLVAATSSRNGCGQLRPANHRVRITTVGNHNSREHHPRLCAGINHQPGHNDAVGDRACQRMCGAVQRPGRSRLAPGCNHRGRATQRLWPGRPLMFPQLPASVRVFLCTRPTDMRKSGSSPKRVGNFAQFVQLEIYIRGFSKA